ncbi:MAG TPA: hypothetical protein VN860_00160, partial [Candidatus Acidoferrales bacterium]|nr:hypothetical protein [Candidatus Acidoferrales bacterium]
RALFAPISSAFAEQKLVRPLDRQLIDPLSETKNCESLPIRAFARQEIRDGFECRRKRERTCQPFARQWRVNAKRDG